MKKLISPLLGRIFKKIGPKIGAKVVLEPEWNIVGQITFKNGRRRYFRYNTVDLNPVGASDISKDKDYSTFFMKRMGYATIPGKAFFSNRWAHAIGSKRNIDAAYRYAVKLGFPVIVKPNSGTQGVGVTKVHTKKEFYKALHVVFQNDRVALVQKVMTGSDYRIVVLDKEIISAYQRIPLNVVGDGRSTIKKLLDRKQKGFVAASRDTRLNRNDFRITQKLQRQSLSMRSVPKKGDQVFLLDNANLSSGGDAVDVTDHIHPMVAKIAVHLTKDMGLRLCGVDILLPNGISKKPEPYWILETNAGPGLDHYVLSGKKQERIVEALYTKVLRALR